MAELAKPRRLMFFIEVTDTNGKVMVKKEYPTASLAVESVAKAAKYYTERKEKVNLKLKDSTGRLIISTTQELYDTPTKEKEVAAVTKQHEGSKET